ncbi:MAG: hypothetical protein GYB31_20145 [Bacteroidetes bacterium]|nr:hypothetical protein [Bacteroidota bacterium]
MNPFSVSYTNDTPDSILVREIPGSNKKSLSQLIQKHQPFIYNIAWKMPGDPDSSIGSVVLFVNALPNPK